MRTIEMVGKRFARLVVIKRANNRGKNVVWLCKCDCGTMAEAIGNSLRNGNKRSCGCLHREVCRKPRTHGLSKTPEYRCWAGMIDRCERTTNDHFDRYGGRGIKICARWRENFEAFLEDMGHRPSPKHSIDRIDNDGNYEPSNCRWATKAQQVKNRSNTHLLTVGGETLCLRDWARRAGINEASLLGRIRRGWDLERAVTTPPRRAERLAG